MYEYKVVEIREGMIGGKMSGDKLEKILNENAARGWQLKAITATEVKGRCARCLASVARASGVVVVASEHGPNLGSSRDPGPPRPGVEARTARADHHQEAE